MTTIMQRIRDHIFNRTFIILQRQPVENNIQDETSLNGSTNNESDAKDISKDMQEDSNAGNVRTRVINKGESNSAESTKIQKNMTDMTSDQVGNFDGKIITPENHVALNISDSKKFYIDLTNLYSDLKSGNSLETRCSGALNLAHCLVRDSPDIELSDCLEALRDLYDSHNFPHLAVCHALLLCSFTKMSMSFEELGMLEENITSLTESLKKKNILKRPELYKIGILVEQHNEIILKLCQGLFCDSYLDKMQIDISTICCCSLYNLSSLVQQHWNELGATYNYKNSTIKYILGMTGRSTQEIVSENMNSREKLSCPSMSSHRIKQCLQVLEHALSINPDLSYCESLQHESFSLPHCLTRLLGWSVSSVFPVKDGTSEETDYFKFHLSTLVCILKILSVLTFNPHQYDSFTNVKGLMEKILICTLKAYFESKKNHFDIQVLCLEMLINLYIKNQKTFILLCLKKFRISDSEEVFAVEALLKMLSDNLEKIKEVKESTPYPQNNDKKESNENSVKNSQNETHADTPDEDTIKKLRNEISEEASSEDPIKKPRKEISEDASNEDPIKKPRKDISEAESTEEPFKKPRKETTEGESTEDSVKKPRKDTTDVLNEASKEKLKKETTAQSDAVLLAASKDMEHSTIVSFICVLIVFFMRTKQNFEEFILARLTNEALKEATVVSKKFLDFASLTGGMPVTGILLLSQTITKLQAMQSS